MSDFHLYRNGVEITPASEWGATWEEVVGGVGTCQVTIQNRDADPALDFHIPSAFSRDIIKMTYGTWVLWEGESIQPQLDLPAGYPFRRWQISGSDWNTVPDLRLINVPGGENLAVDPGGDAALATTDPGGPRFDHAEAVAGGTDRDTIQRWYDLLVLAPDGGAFDTDDTRVLEYVDVADPSTGEPNFVASMGTLAAAIAGVSAMAAVPVFDWIDPDRQVHHTSTDDMPTAPLEITDVRAEWDGTTKIGGRGLKITADYSYGPQVAYVNGVTPLFRAAGSGTTLYQGTGWGHSDSGARGFDEASRQILLDAQATTRAQRDAVADAQTAYAARPRYRGEISVGGRDDEGNGLPIITGFRAGQRLTVTDARLGELSGVPWPIQRLRGKVEVGLTPDPNGPPEAILSYTFEFGDGPIQRVSAKVLTHGSAADGSTKRSQTAPRHVIAYQVLNPKPGQAQWLVSQARGQDDLPTRAPGIPVHWEILTVTDELGADKSGNGESVTPEDTNTDQNGQSVTLFTAGSLTGVWYQIEASTPYFDG